MPLFKATSDFVTCDEIFDWHSGISALLVRDTRAIVWLWSQKMDVTELSFGGRFEGNIENRLDVNWVRVKDLTVTDMDFPVVVLIGLPELMLYSVLNFIKSCKVLHLHDINYDASTMRLLPTVNVDAVSIQRGRIPIFPVCFCTSYLKNLSIQNSGLTSLPDEIGRCSTLSIVTLHGNSLQQFPDAVLDLTLTSIFVMDDKKFTTLQGRKRLTTDGDVREHEGFLDAMPTLRFLFVVHCPLFTLPVNFGNQRDSQLAILHLWDNHSTHIPDSICDLKKLTGLDLSYPHLVSLPVRFGDLQNINSLCLKHCYKLVQLPHSFSRLKLLKQGSVSYGLPIHLCETSDTMVGIYSGLSTWAEVKTFVADNSPVRFPIQATEANIEDPEFFSCHTSRLVYIILSGMALRENDPSFTQMYEEHQIHNVLDGLYTDEQ